MISCLLIAFALCNPNYVPQQYYQPPVYVAQPQVIYAQPVYVAPQPVYYAQPYYGGGYAQGYPFGGISVAVGPRGGVRVGVNR